MSVTLYEVGGCIRDDYLGIPTKDVDYAVTGTDWFGLRTWLGVNGFVIFEENAKTFTMRAQFPKEPEWTFAGRDCTGMAADFTLARKERNYTDGRHPDVVELGTLEDDLLRRDFTCNGLAKDVHGNIIDIVDGLYDLKWKILRCVGSAQERFTEDALRAIRALRFSITKGLSPDEDIVKAWDSVWLPPLLEAISVDRRRDELTACFKYDTMLTLACIETFSGAMKRALFAGGIWLEPTNKGKKKK